MFRGGFRRRASPRLYPGAWTCRASMPWGRRRRRVSRLRARAGAA